MRCKVKKRECQVHIRRFRSARVHMDGNVLRNARHTFPTYVQPLRYNRLRFLSTNFYKYTRSEVGGWAPPTELSQSSGAAAHTYTWFSLTTYLLI